MADIYRKASRLVIWLGHGITKEEDEDAAEVLCILRDDELDQPIYMLRDILPAHRKAQSHSKRPGEAIELYEPMLPLRLIWNFHQIEPCMKWLRLALARSNAGHLLRQRMRSDFDPEDVPYLQQSEEGVKALLSSELFRHTGIAMVGLYRTLLRLCQRRYFTRRWIVQEIYHSNWNAVQLRWSTFRISAHEFRQRLSNMHSLLTSSPWSMESLQNSDHKIHDRTLGFLYVHSAVWPANTLADDAVLLQCLREFQHTDCADDRDRIYAFMRMAGTTPLLKVDYHLTACHVFTALAGELAKRDLLNLVLYVASWQQSTLVHDWKLQKRRIGLPSWVPDLACRMPRYTPYGTARSWSANIEDEHRSERVEVLGHGEVLQCRAKIGRLTSIPEHQFIRDALRGVCIGDYLCEAGQYLESAIDFILQPVPSRPGYFTLARSWTMHFGTKETAWDCCIQVEVKTIYII